MRNVDEPQLRGGLGFTCKYTKQKSVSSLGRREDIGSKYPTSGVALQDYHRKLPKDTVSA